MRLRLLQNSRLQPSLERALASRYDIHALWNEPDPSSFLAQHGSEFIGLVTSAAIGVDNAVINALSSLRVISIFGVGLDKIDLNLARKRGIAVGYTPDVLNDAVADMAFALLLNVARGISSADRFVRQGDWPKGLFRLTTQVSRKHLGILGLGRIGKVIAKRASGFDMDIRYYNRHPVEGVPYTHESSLLTLAAWSDFLVIATTGGAQTHHLVDAQILEALGPHGYLINIARGSIVDETALIDALTNRRIAGAGLDVFENEPAVPEALLPLDNVVMTPHIASSTLETRQAMEELVLKNLENFFSTGKVLQPAL
jgi:lactate dehydrogenase-like 2-hydroxyacid dehydrogenase